MANLTEKQEAFLDALFDPDVEFDLLKAKHKVGYSKTQPLSQVVAPIRSHIISRAEEYLVMHLPQAVSGLVNSIKDPTQLGIQHKIKAITELMDRVGVVKTDKVEVSTKETPIVILPQKNDG